MMCHITQICSIPSCPDSTLRGNKVSAKRYLSNYGSPSMHKNDICMYIRAEEHAKATYADLATDFAWLIIIYRRAKERKAISLIPGIIFRSPVLKLYNLILIIRESNNLTVFSSSWLVYITFWSIDIKFQRLNSYTCWVWRSWIDYLWVFFASEAEIAVIWYLRERIDYILFILFYFRNLLRERTD